MSTAEGAHFDLNLTPQRRGGRLWLQAVVRHGDEVVARDTFDPGSRDSRAGLARQIEEQASARGVPFDRDEFDRVLLREADQYDASRLEPQPPITRINHQELLDALGLEVLGERPNQAIVCWVRRTQKRWEIKSPAKWAPEEMLQALGEQGERLLWLGPRPTPPSMFTPDDLRHAVAIAASVAPRLVDAGMYGQGIWREQSDFIIVNGANAHRYDGERFEVLNHPRLGQRLIDFSATAQWGDNLPDAVASMNAATASELLARLETLLACWNWSHPQDHRVQAALIPATFVQTCWRWRPLNSIIGPSDSGKSTLLQELLAPLFGCWTIMADRSTEAGLRQAIGHHAVPVIVDEFDKYRQRQQVLELFRTSSRGGRILRGTQDQQGQAFGLKHLVHFAAIESGNKWGQDRNRFIQAELRSPQNRGRLSLPGPDELHELGQQIAAAALWAIPAAMRIADAIKSTQIEGVHGRLIESFAVPAAMSAVLTHGRDVQDSTAAEFLRAFVADRTTLDAQGELDEIQLLQDILSQTVKVAARDGNVDRTIAQIVVDQIRPRREASVDRRAITAIENVGLRVLTRGREALFVVHGRVKETLLKGTRWDDTCVDQMLVRLPGAGRTQQRCAGMRLYGIEIPVAGCLERLLDLDEERDSASAWQQAR